MHISIDIGGTNTRIGVSKDGRRFFAIEKFKTPRKFEDGMRDITRTVLRMSGGRSSGHPKIAVAVPGPVDRAGRVLHVPNLPDWRGKLSARALSHALTLSRRERQFKKIPLSRRERDRVRGKHPPKIILVNDADAAGLGEALRGAGRGYASVGYLTLSTGIGGTLIIKRTSGNRPSPPPSPAGRGGFRTSPLPLGEGQGEGRARNTYILSAEPGHQILFPGGRKCGAGHPGCFEAYGSGTGFYKTYGVRPEQCRDKKIWERHAQTVGWGLINTIVHWSPDVVVIGGGLSRAGTLLFTPLRAYVLTHLKIFKPPPILPAKLGDNAGLYGCLALLQSTSLP